MTKFILTIALGATLAACGTPEQAENPGATDANPTEAAGATPAATPDGDAGVVIATVAGVSVRSREFQMAAQRVSPKDGVALSTEEKQEILDKLVVEKILYVEAKKRNIDLDPKVQKVMINTLLRADVYDGVRSSDFDQAELEAYFTAHLDEFVVPEKVQIKRIFIKINDTRDDAAAKALVSDLRAKVLASPASFKDLAAKNSEDPYRRRGGDLGFISKEGKPGIDPAIIDVAFTLEEGGVSDVFLAGGGYNLVMAAAKRQRVERTFEQMKGSVLRKVKNERYKTLYDEYVNRVRAGYTVDIDASALESVEIRAARRLSLGKGGPKGAGGGGH